MQVRAQDDVDLLGLDAGGTQAGEIGCVELVEAGEARPLLVIAGAAVDQDRVAWRADQPGMYAADQPVVLNRIVIGHQPAEMRLDQAALEADQIFFGRNAGEAELLLHARDAHFADGPGRHRRALSLTVRTRA
jgi:hypothetical protein